MDLLIAYYICRGFVDHLIVYYMCRGFVDLLIAYYNCGGTFVEVSLVIFAGLLNF